MKIVVAPLAGARIEIRITGTRANAKGSLPSRERGLKSKMPILSDKLSFVAPLAGARIEIVRSYCRSVKAFVAPLAGARIEIVVWIGYE